MLDSAKRGSATNDRNFRTFLLMAQFEAREIGARIQLARKERGMTQEELAELCDVTPRALQNWEAGQVPYRHLKNLGRFLNRPEEWFLYGDQEPEQDEAVMARLDRIERLLESLVAQAEPPSQQVPNHS